MNKKELIERIAELDSVKSKAEAGRILELITDTIVNEVVDGKSVIISGFGKFYNFTRSNGVKAAKFKAFAAFKQAVVA
jgi:nucleoid DNA-binding protein